MDKAELERLAALEAKATRTTAEHGEMLEAIPHLLAYVRTLQERVDELEGALEPFLMQGWDVGKPEPDEVLLSIIVTRGDLRHARTVLAKRDTNNGR